MGPQWGQQIAGSVYCLIFSQTDWQNINNNYWFFHSQAWSSVPPPPQDSIDEFVIPKLNPLVVVDFRFISTFLHA